MQNNGSSEMQKRSAKQIIREDYRSVPNIMSMFRIVLIPVILVTYLKDYRALSVAAIVVSAITDLADGIVARHCNMVTDLGKALDPVADKLTLGAIMICFAVQKTEFLFIVIAMVVKETLGFIMHFIIFRLSGGMYGAEWYGKVSTWVLYITAGCYILFDRLPANLLRVMIGLCILTTLFACAMYTIRCAKIIRERRKARG